MGNCDYCIYRKDCTRTIGDLFGGCAIEFEPDTEVIYKRLDNLEDCKDNPVYAQEIRRLRDLL